jgi:hypothetical protein
MSDQSAIPTPEDIAAELEAISDEPDHLEPVEETAQADPEPVAQTASEVEALAEEMGWRRDFNGREAVSAKEYIKRQQGFLRDSSRQLRELKEATAKHGEALVRIQKESMAEARRLAQAELDDAVRMGDTRAASAAVEKLKAADAPIEQPAAPRIDSDVETFVRDWIGGNEWFRTDQAAVALSDAVYRQEIQANGGVDDPRVILPKVEAAVRKRFPEHFATPEPETPRPTPPAVNGTPRQSNVVTRTNAKGWNDLDQLTRSMGAAIVNEPSFMPHLKTAAEKRAAYAAAYFKDN